VANKENPNPGINEPEKKPSLLERLVSKRNEWAAEQPKLSGQLEALWREGLKDLQNAVLHAFPDSQRLVEEPGAPLTPTQQQVTAEQGNVHGYGAQLDQAASRGGHDRDREGMSR
jgi:hypothetical protein